MAVRITVAEYLPIALITISVIYIVACGTFTVIARTHLYNYYTAAHIALMSIFVGLFVISHHAFKIRQALSHREKTFSKVQFVLNSVYLICTVVTFIGYCVVCGLSIHTNYDYVASMLLSLINTAALVYLTGIVLYRVKAERLWRSDNHVRTITPDSYASRESMQSRRDAPMVTHHGTNTRSSDFSDFRTDESEPVVLKTEKSTKRRLCCTGCLRFSYYLGQSLLLLTFLFSATHPCGVADDIRKYREDASMVTVTLPGHRPLAFFVKCAGNGSETVLFENGLGGQVYMGWSLIPANLSRVYRVCTYDRRGYGWSEGFEHDFNGVQEEEPQWAGSNIDFLEKIIEAAGIPTPFYYVGHSYGGYHMTLLSLKKPELIKGLVFLDSARFSPLATLRSFMSIIANIHASGLIRIILDTKILNHRKVFSNVVDFESLPPKDENILLSSFKSGYFFATYVRESKPLVGSDFASTRLSNALAGKVINKPVLVIDAGDRQGGEWLPSVHFPLYNSTYSVSVDGTDHQTLIYSRKYAWKTTDLISDFIQKTS